MIRCRLSRLRSLSRTLRKHVLFMTMTGAAILWLYFELCVWYVACGTPGGKQTQRRGLHCSAS